jgi:hypothetical protein
VEWPPVIGVENTPRFKMSDRTLDRGTLTWASTRVAHAATSSMLADAAVALSSFVTNLVLSQIRERVTAASNCTRVVPGPGTQALSLNVTSVMEQPRRNPAPILHKAP